MRQGVIDRLDPAEIFLVHLVKRAGPAVRLLAQITGHHGHRIIKHVAVRHLQTTTAFFELATDVLVKHRIKNNSGIAFDIGQDTRQLRVGSDQRPDMFMGTHIGKLRDTGARDAINGFPG